MPATLGSKKLSMIQHIRENVIGLEASFDGPFGRRRGVCLAYYNDSFIAVYIYCVKSSMSP